MRGVSVPSTVSIPSAHVTTFHNSVLLIHLEQLLKFRLRFVLVVALSCLTLFLLCRCITIQQPLSCQNLSQKQCLNPFPLLLPSFISSPLLTCLFYKPGPGGAQRKEWEKGGRGERAAQLYIKAVMLGTPRNGGAGKEVERRMVEDERGFTWMRRDLCDGQWYQCQGVTTGKTVLT